MITVTYKANNLTLRMIENQAREDRGKRLIIKYITRDLDVIPENISKIEKKYNCIIELIYDGI